MGRVAVSTKKRRSAALSGARIGLLRATLLFGSVAIALSLVAVPAIERRSRVMASADQPQLDTMITGSVRSSGARRQYVVSRSVLQPAGAAPCITYAGGGRSGSC
ncbi:hypothetical protein [Mangrovicella endophytica]|uniref:hypothetical protein n=1 Tax=Mangrovicella endophytica TaxID=2066697 RepID=UPI001FDF920E|nr:hypothetical protein [Mangrovicella endophytica]